MHPNDVESLLKFADMVRAVRTTESNSTPKATRSSEGLSGRISLAVLNGMDSLKVKVSFFD